MSPSDAELLISAQTTVLDGSFLEELRDLSASRSGSSTNRHLSSDLYCHPSRASHRKIPSMAPTKIRKHGSLIPSPERIHPANRTGPSRFHRAYGHLPLPSVIDETGERQHQEYPVPLLRQRVPILEAPPPAYTARKEMKKKKRILAEDLIDEEENTDTANAEPGMWTKIFYNIGMFLVNICDVDPSAERY